jgi:hypothetical protein
MTENWADRVAAVWAEADSLTDEEVLQRIDSLVAERGVTDAAAVLEAAGVRDYLGLEAGAEPLYRTALAMGLEGDDHAKATIQFASTLRNLGRAEQAVDLLNDYLEEHPATEWTPAAAAFLSLALVSAGREREAASVALVALSGRLPAYGAAVRRYALEVRRG